MRLSWRACRGAFLFCEFVGGSSLTLYFGTDVSELADYNPSTKFLVGWVFESYCRCVRYFAGELCVFVSCLDDFFCYCVLYVNLNLTGIPSVLCQVCQSLLLVIQ